MAEGMTAITSAMEFLTSNSTFVILIGAAVALPIISGVLGLFYRK